MAYLANGISIPSSYSAYLAPLSSSKLYNEVRAGKEDKASETPYVVMFQAVNILSGAGGGDGGRCGAQIQECWEFEHPRRDVVLDDRGRSSEAPMPDQSSCPALTVFTCISGLPVTNSHNTRSATLTFHIPHAGVLHGLAGYFEAVLYGKIGLSIHPIRKEHISKDMLSWFPLFFPLRVRPYILITRAVLSSPPNIHLRMPVLIGTVILAEQFRASGLHLAPD
jgi:protein arginine N-methyltransferase 5